MSIQGPSGVRIPLHATRLIPDPESLSTMENEIWSKKIQFDCLPDGILIKRLNCPENDYVRR
jgi:hypothetical protein